MKKNYKISIIGTGKIGTAIANGLLESGEFDIPNITLADLNVTKLNVMKEKGFKITGNNIDAVKKSDIIIISVEPHHANQVFEEIRNDLNPEKHTLISVVTGFKIDHIKSKICNDTDIIRVMPNTAVAVRESMTCIAFNNVKESSKERVASIFDTVGETVIISEELMPAATALCACGTAFFMRAVRAASQGGIEVGFHSEIAISMAAQTAKGAAKLILSKGRHPEFEIDKVTTPMGCTIAGLNRMEHEGFSSSIIKGITTSAKKASELGKTK
ncbi:MAG TPA: pyrroline-5-carboxylate reductase [Victivallales bacterium]|nr:pyrroline-5-carboxylate reductase [Victivallales bacterium]